jgi:hypothetical protein
MSFIFSYLLEIVLKFEIYIAHIYTFKIPFNLIFFLSGCEEKS